MEITRKRCASTREYTRVSDGLCAIFPPVALPPRVLPDRRSTTAGLLSRSARWAVNDRGSLSICHPSGCPDPRLVVLCRTFGKERPVQLPENRNRAIFAGWCPRPTHPHPRKDPKPRRKGAHLRGMPHEQSGMRSSGTPSPSQSSSSTRTAAPTASLQQDMIASDEIPPQTLSGAVAAPVGRRLPCGRRSLDRTGLRFRRTGPGRGARTVAACARPQPGRRRRTARAATA